MAGKKFRPDWYRFYRQQKGNAKLRGIEFLLTPEEWWGIWERSGHWQDRGRRSHQYCMARFGDKGPYAADNVEITTTQHNNIIGSTGRQHTSETKDKIRAANKGPFTQEHCLNISKAKTGKRCMPRGSYSAGHRERISKALRAYWERRRS